MTRVLASTRGRLVLLLIVASLAILALAWNAASGSLSYYSTPEEFATRFADEGSGETRWRVGGRVVDGSIVERNGRPVAWDIVGEGGERLSVTYDGVVPDLFGPFTFVVIDGVASSATLLHASEVRIKHENEFFADTPPEDTISYQLLSDTPTTE
jgi:cytochrome c-type biogenesis protein CcmE